MSEEARIALSHVLDELCETVKDGHRLDLQDYAVLSGEYNHAQQLDFDIGVDAMKEAICEDVEVLFRELCSRLSNAELQELIAYLNDLSNKS